MVVLDTLLFVLGRFALGIRRRQVSSGTNTARISGCPLFWKKSGKEFCGYCNNQIKKERREFRTYPKILRVLERLSVFV